MSVESKQQTPTNPVEDLKRVEKDLEEKEKYLNVVRIEYIKVQDDVLRLTNGKLLLKDMIREQDAKHAQESNQRELAALRAELASLKKQNGKIPKVEIVEDGS